MVSLARALHVLPLGLALAATPVLAGPPADACANLAPPAAVPAEPLRPIIARDLIALRDIGGIDARLVGDPPMSVSPDARRVAFHLRRASLEQDRYCMGIFVMEIAPGARPRQVDRGGTLILSTISIAGLEEFPSGTPNVITPRWSPDGKSLLYLRRDHGVTQAWIAPADGSRPARRVTRSPVDVKDAAWLGDGRSIAIATRPSLVRFRERVEREASKGWLYDGRFFPPGGMAPNPVSPLPVEYSVVDIVSGAVRRATDSEAERLRARPSGFSSKALITAESRDGRRAWTEPVDAEAFQSPTRLRVSIAGKELVCAESVCADRVQGLWWLAGGDLLILRIEDQGEGTMAMYRWSPGVGKPRLVLRTTERLIGCQEAAGSRLLCAHESATRPRHLAFFDPESGDIEPLLDLNPELAQVRLAPARRLVWRNAYGTQTFGDLVLPPHHRVGERYPMIVVQYSSEGFLRGGTGDENPVQLLAARGYAVLSVQRPSEHIAAIKASSREEAYRAQMEGWWDRRQVQSSLETGIAAVEALGVIDPTRIGITGLSDGAGAAWFALVNSNLFAAAALSTCCEEPAWNEGLNGPGYAAEVRRQGYPVSGEKDFRSFWQPYALSMNASLPSVPILIQAADREALMAVHTHWALKSAGWPIEMYVFPGEMHIKVGPHHRAAIYQRTIDWFDYWLRGVRDPDPGKAEQYRRWDALPRPTRLAGCGPRLSSARP